MSWKYFLCLALSILLVYSLLGTTSTVSVANTFTIAPGTYSWPTFHHDNRRSGFSESPVGSSLVGTWLFSTGGYPVYAEPILADGIAYFGDSRGIFYALDETTGEMLWNFTTNGAILHSAAITGSSVFFGSDDHFVYAVNSSTGELLWKRETIDKISTSITVDGELVFVGSDDGNLYALNSTTGVVNWNYYFGKPVAGGTVVYNGVVYACAHVTPDHKETSYCAFNEITGASESVPYFYPFNTIDYERTADGYLSIAPNGYFVDAFYSGAAFAYSKRRWNIQVRGGGWWGGIEYGEYGHYSSIGWGRVIAIIDNELFSYDLVNGHIYYGRVYIPPLAIGTAIANSTVLVSFRNGVAAYDLFSGIHLWNISLSSVYTNPVVADGIVLVGTDLGLQAIGTDVSIIPEFPNGMAVSLFVSVTIIPIVIWKLRKKLQEKRQNAHTMATKDDHRN